MTSPEPVRKQVRTIEPYRHRAPRKKGAEVGRYCWVCGRSGGLGFTSALRGAGYFFNDRNEMGFAHPSCMGNAMKQAAEREHK